MGSIIIKICAIIACFLFAAGFAAGAAKAFDEKKWSDFGLNYTLSASFLFGMLIIMQMWCGVA